MKRIAQTIALLVGLVACSDSGTKALVSPYSAEAWIAKLDDPKEVERAVTNLQNLCNPVAIRPLGEAWERDGQPTRTLLVIIDLASALTAERAEQTGCSDYARTGRPAHWVDALPFLREALESVEADNERSIASAVRAAKALGDSLVAGGAQILLDVIDTRPPPPVRDAATAALARYNDAVR